MSNLVDQLVFAVKSIIFVWYLYYLFGGRGGGAFLGSVEIGIQVLTKTTTFLLGNPENLMLTHINDFTVSHILLNSVLNPTINTFIGLYSLANL